MKLPIYSIPSLANEFLPIYPANVLLRYKFPTWKYLQEVREPVIIFHGTQDRVIPYDNARMLISYLKKDDRFISIPGGQHYGIPKSPIYQDTLDSLLSH